MKKLMLSRPRHKYSNSFQPHAKLIDELALALEQSHSCSHPCLLHQTEAALVLKSIKYVARGGIEISFEKIRHSKTANCYGLSAVYASLLLRTLDCTDGIFMLIGVRREAANMGVHAWVLYKNSQGSILFDPSNHGVKKYSDNAWLQEIVVSLAFNEENMWVGGNRFMAMIDSNYGPLC